MLLGARRQRRAPRAHVNLGRRHANPVLQAVGGLGRDGIVLQEKQPGKLAKSKLRSAHRLRRPSNQDDIHVRDATGATLRECFGMVKGCGRRRSVAVVPVRARR